RNTLSRSDQFSVQFRNNKTDSLSCACAVRHNVNCRCARSSQIAFSLRSVKCHLIACVSVDCAHDTGFDRCKIVQSLSHRSKAVCCTGCCGNDVVILCQCLVVYIVNDCRKIISCRSGDDNFLSARIDVCLSFFFLCIEACTLKNYVNTDLSPRKVVSISFSVDFDLFAVNSDGILSCLNFVSQCVFALC